MFQELKSIADADPYTSSNTFTGDDPHKWPSFAGTVLDYAQTKEHGKDMMSSAFVAPEPSQDLLKQIEDLSKATREFVPPQGGTQDSRNALIAIYNANVGNLGVRNRELETITRKKDKMVLTAGAIIQFLKSITSGRLGSIINTASSDKSIPVCSVPSFTMSTARSECYPPGSAGATVKKIKKETDSLPLARTTDDIRNNATFCSKALVNIEGIKQEQKGYWDPILARVAQELAALNLQLQELQQPPANLAAGQVFQLDQQAVAAKQEEINNKIYQQRDFTQQQQFDSVRPLDEQELGTALYNSIPTNSQDNNVNDMRTKIQQLVFDRTNVHPYSTYSYAILTLHGQQSQGRIASAPFQPQQDNRHAGYSARDDPSVEPTTAYANAAYANPPSRVQPQRQLPEEQQICRVYQSPNGCHDQNCLRIHRNDNYHLPRRQNNNQGGQGNYQGNYQNQGNYNGNYQSNQNQGNNGGGYNGGGYNGGGYNGDQRRGRSRSPGGRPLYDNNDQRQRQRTGPSPQREQGPPQNPPPQNPPPPGRGRSQSPNRGQYPGRGGSPYRSRDSSQG